MNKIIIDITVNVTAPDGTGKADLRIEVSENLLVYLDHEEIGKETARLIDKALEDYRKAIK
jgi:hypothetical protein